jgi:hypothetical protein
MRDQSKHAEATRHQRVWELIPWYVNGTLSDTERTMVTQHLALCQICQGEVVRCQSIVATVHSTAEVEWTPSQENLERLMGRLEYGTASTILERWWSRVRDWLQRNLEAVQIAPSLLRWGLAVQTSMIILLAGTIVWHMTMTPQIYQTLSEGGAALEPGRTQISVVFVEDITEGELRSLLSTVQGTLVAGPSPLAVYIVSVPVSGTEPDARTSLALDMLRKHPKVRLAEPRQ